MKQLKYASLMPLIGGQTLGHKEASGELPEIVYPVKEFGNSRPLQEYWDKVKFKALEKDLTIDDRPENLDLVSSIPLCSGLSMLNTATNSSKGRGASAEQNDWMYKTTEAALEQLDPKVFMLENAPGLFSKIGVEVAKGLYNIAKKSNRSLTFYRTNSRLHGIPQNRPRTFVFFWRSETAPILEWIKRTPPDIEDYLRLIPEDATLQDVYFPHEPLQRNVYYQYVTDRWGKDWRKEIPRGDGIMSWLRAQNELGDCLTWLKDKQFIEKDENRIERFQREIARVTRVMNKTSGGIWDSTPFVTKEWTPAIISKNVWRMIHPSKDRFMNVREYMWLMGLPHDFQLKDTKEEKRWITQNVPVTTAKDMTLEVMKWLDGKLEMSDKDVVMQDNTKEVVSSPDWLGPELPQLF